MKPDDDTTEPLSDAAQRRRQQLLSMATTQIAANPSLGERLLPFLMAAMEACWVDAIFIGLAGLGLFQSRQTFIHSPVPIIPLWAPFVFIAGSQWLASYLVWRDVSATSSSNKDDNTNTVTPGTSLVFVLTGVVTLFIIWLRIYAQAAFVLDPRWLLNMLNDILLLNSNIYPVVSIAALCVYLSWRGVRLSRRLIEPAQVFSVLRLGLMIFIAVIIVRAGQESAGVIFSDGPILFLLIPIFLFLCLIAHSLARAAYVRRSHPVGLQGSSAAQERSILLTSGIFSAAILLIALVVGSTANPTFLGQIAIPLGAAYDWLIGIIAHIIVFLVTPIFWLINLIFAGHKLQSPGIRLNPLGGVGNTKTHKPQATPDLILVLIPILRIAFPILFILGLILLIRWAMRRRRVRLVAGKNEDVYESLWSWALFWTQLKAFLRGMFGRLFARKAAAAGELAAAEAITGGLAARSVREIYRLLLRRAADRGYPRRRDETPYEFRQRLDAKTPLAQPRLEIITAVYAATRYGGLEPDEAEVAQVRGAWAEIEQKWNEPRSAPSPGRGQAPPLLGTARRRTE
jgi:hypothetical protein